jgi:UDP-GlcNAc:undecaprenyl-phosphate GlcNAc-1-phosphate transferase
VSAIFTGILALIVTAILVAVARRIAPAIGLVDVPDERKAHNGNIPLVGGIAIFTGLLITMVVDGFLAEHWPFFAAASFLVVVGAWDDANGLSPIVRIVIQAAAVLFLAVAGDVYIADLGSILPVLGTVSLDWMAIPFTVFAGVGIINAFNMSDGVDGLCGTLALVSLTGLGILAGVAGRQSELLLILALTGGLIGFLIFNVRVPGRKQAKAFLGDAGSYLLGLSVLYLAVRLSQGSDRAMTPVTALWLCMLPLVDTVGMILRRIRRGRSPFTPDREHIHHIFLLAKFSVTSTWIGLAAVAAIGMAFGVSGTLVGMPESTMLATFLIVGVLYYAMIMRAWKVMRFLSRSINRRAEKKIDRRSGGPDRRQREEIYFIDGVPFERRSGQNRRQRDRRNEADELSESVPIFTQEQDSEDRPGKRAARLS